MFYRDTFMFNRGVYFNNERYNKNIFAIRIQKAIIGKLF